VDVDCGARVLGLSRDVGTVGIVMYTCIIDIEVMSRAGEPNWGAMGNGRGGTEGSRVLGEEGLGRRRKGGRGGRSKRAGESGRGFGRGDGKEGRGRGGGGKRVGEKMDGRRWMGKMGPVWGGRRRAEMGRGAGGGGVDGLRGRGG